MRIALSVLAAMASVAVNAADGAAELGMKIAPGFKVTLYADSNLANDIYCMTLDSKGRVVVSSAGWIKTLHDTDGDGVADKVTQFAKTYSGGMGMFFDGNDLLFTGEGHLMRFRDADGDGVADGPAEKITKVSFGEHGGHAPRKGPDGCWYLIGGNDAGITKEHINVPESPVTNPEAGSMIRFSPDFKQSEVISTGTRNPYDFDFNAAGDIFCYDSDCERDYFLPWYTPTRIYHLATGMHHGWRLKGWERSFCRLDYYADNVDILWPIGRGSPTGVACYRHEQFPARYRGGIFALDWTFGKVWFLPLQPKGASYTTKAEVFLEPVGSVGFAPTDVAIAPDGSMFVSIGGRRTRGAVYHIEYVGDGSIPVKAPTAPASDVAKVLAAHQPLDSWSRAQWMPLAEKLGAKEFEAALLKPDLDSAGRVRAIEILTELFNGLSQEFAKGLSENPDAAVRARTAWSLGRKPSAGATATLSHLAEDADAHVRVNALEALTARVNLAAEINLPALLASNFAHADKRVRHAAALLAVRSPEATWSALQAELEKSSPLARLTGAMSAIWRSADNSSTSFEKALAILSETKDKELQLQAVRLIVLALGDCNLNKPPLELHANYSLPASPLFTDASAARIESAISSIFQSGDEKLDGELVRLIAMVQASGADLPNKISSFWTPKSSATWDVHYLIALSRLKSPFPADLAPKIADTLLSLGTKLEGQQQRTKQQWDVRLTELVTLLLKREPRLANEILKSPKFVNPAHVSIAARLENAQRLDAARLFLAAVKSEAKFQWSESLISLLSQLPADEFFPVLRAQWTNIAMRDSILLHLSKNPDEADRDKFLSGVESVNSQTVNASLGVLEKLPRDENPKNLLPLLQHLRRLMMDAKAAPARQRVLALISRQSGQSFTIKEEGTEPSTLKKTYQPVFDWFTTTHAKFADALKGEGDEEDAAALAALMKAAPWDNGDVKRGETVFRDRGCQTCHAVQGALGPNLSGAASRFSREDLFQAITQPSRDVADLYRATVFRTKDGQVYTGIIAFDSADGYIVQTGATTTVRIDTADIVSKRVGNVSLMPNGLLKGAKPEDLADLYAYLRSLGK